MFYVLLTADGNVDCYPYTLTDLRFDNPGTSFSETITDATAASFNCFPVTSTSPPANDYTVNLERTAIKQDDIWIEHWFTTPATPEQITQRTATKASEVRVDRNQRLANCDWTQLSDAPVDKNIWVTYRQQLRDITKQTGFPWNITWPEQP